MYGGMKVKIGYKNYPIIWSTDGDCGNCDPNLGVIWVSDKMPLEEQAVTLLHEVLHAIWSDRAMPEKAIEEAAVDGLSRGLATVFIDNPEFLEWLGEALNGDGD